MTSVALIDDHSLFSVSLAAMLRGQGLDVLIPHLSSIEEIRDEVTGLHTDVVIVDRDLGAVGNGETLIDPFVRAGSSVIVLSARLDDVVIGRCLARGATTCISKREPFERLLSTVLAVADGTRPLSEQERYAFIDAWRHWQNSTDVVMGPFSKLTQQEASVLRDLMNGRSVKLIASERYLSSATVRTHVRGILTKLGVGSQLEATALARQAGWDFTSAPTS